MYSQSMIPQGKYTTRVIVDYTGGVTKNIDKYISTIIMKKWILCQEFEAHCRHDQRSQSRKLWSTCVLRFDSLEPKCPQDEAVELIWKHQMSAGDVIKLFKLCVQKTIFCSTKKLFIKINGLAIGASTSGFADQIFLERLEARAFKTFIDPPIIWKRYVDDNFCKIK